MLAIMRTHDSDTGISSFTNASVVLRDGSNMVTGKPDLPFNIRTFEKISKEPKENEESSGEKILLPINMFFNTLNFVEQSLLYDTYRTIRNLIVQTNDDNWKQHSGQIEELIDTVFQRLNLSSRLVSFCATDNFSYPDLSDIGKGAHHTPEKSFYVEHYIEVTAISLISKMMVPIWGEWINKIRDLNIDHQHVEDYAYVLIESVLRDDVLFNIHKKLYRTISHRVQMGRDSFDTKQSNSGVTSSYILTHNGINDEMFDKLVFSTVVIKRLASFDCFPPLDPNIIVFIENVTKRTVESRLQALHRLIKNIMPRKKLAQHDTEDNISILDHASKTSKKPIDDPVFISVAVEMFEIPKLIEETDTPVALFAEAVNYYRHNSFDFSPLCEAMVASFIGMRFGGSKCLEYLSAELYQQLVVLLQIFLIKQKFYDLALLLTSVSSLEPVEGVYGSMATRIDSNLKSNEYYLQCEELFKGWVEKPVSHADKKIKDKKIETERINFENTIKYLKDWIVQHTHQVNIVPSMWNMMEDMEQLVTGELVPIDQRVVENLCRFNLLFHGTKRPF